VTPGEAGVDGDDSTGTSVSIGRSLELNAVVESVISIGSIVNGSLAVVLNSFASVVDSTSTTDGSDVSTAGTDSVVVSLSVSGAIEGVEKSIGDVSRSAGVGIGVGFGFGVFFGPYGG
jgi:hypothetical protein